MDTAASILWIASVAIFVFAVVYAISTVALIVLSLVEATLIKIERGELFAPPARRRPTSSRERSRVPAREIRRGCRRPSPS